MAAGLGEAVEGTYREVISRKPTTASTPYMCILDEYGYYAVKGFAVVPAQARSLGFSVIFAGQDLPAFQKASKEEAASIGANTNIKICMKLEDPQETWEFFHKTAGESYVTKVDSFQTNAGSLLNNYMDSRSASSEKRQRVDLLDLKEQREGEAHIFFKSKIVRARMFFANPQPAEKMRINHFLKVEPPFNRVLIDLENRLSALHEVLQSGESLAVPQDEGEELQIVCDSLSSLQNVNPIERSLSALMAFHNRNAVEEGVEGEEAGAVVEEAQDDGRLNIFSKVSLTDPIKAIVGNDIDSFSLPLINKSYSKDNIELLERLLGRPSSQANPMTQEIIKDMLQATDYPPPLEGLLLPSEEVVAIANKLCDYVTSLGNKAADESK
jgi:intracellular multiplication protein IcmO